MKQIVEEFGSETSLHGIPRVINAKSIQLKIVWSVVFFCSFGMVVFMLTSLTMQYFSYPVVVKVHRVSMYFWALQPVLQPVNLSWLYTILNNSRVTEGSLFTVRVWILAL